MTEPSAAPMTLLVHDGELAEVRALLGELGTPFTERRGPLCPEDRDARWDLVIGTPKRILRIHLDPANRPTQIAVLDEDSRTLRNSLRRADIQVVVRRPVHPAALRAVILHALYRGPEKRRSTRVSVGAPVRYRVRWRRRPAILADLSLGGCRLLTDRRVDVGRTLALQLPAGLAGGRGFSLRARVLRSAAAPGGPGGTLAVTARFERVSPGLHGKLKRAIASHASGPATFEAEDRRAPAPPRPERAVPVSPARSEAAPGGPDVREVSHAPKVPAASAPLVPAPTDVPAGAGERRRSPRHALERRVIALGDEASRVLMGRDISVGGMRVGPNPNLHVGEDLQLAVHLGDRELPLVVRARVHRDDGERGVVLRFHDLAEEASRYLDETVDALPLVDADGSEGVLVTEILEVG